MKKVVLSAMFLSVAVMLVSCSSIYAEQGPDYDAVAAAKRGCDAAKSKLVDAISALNKAAIDLSTAIQKDDGIDAAKAAYKAAKKVVVDAESVVDKAAIDLKKAMTNVGIDKGKGGPGLPVPVLPVVAPVVPVAYPIISSYPCYPYSCYPYYSSCYYPYSYVSCSPYYVSYPICY